MATIAAPERILGSVGQSQANLRHPALLSLNPLPSKWVGEHQLGWLDLGAGVRGQKGDEELFSGLSVWLLMHARTVKVTNQYSLPSFSFLFL